MRIKNKLAAVALLGATAAVVPAMAGTGVAQAAPRTAVTPKFVTSSPCNTRANSFSVFMHNSLECVSFDTNNGGGTVSDLDLFNTFQVNTQLYSGYFKFLTGGAEHRLDFTPWQVIKFNANVTVDEVHLN